MSALSWDSQQKEIIEADASTRMLVEAGPGTGKTAVACARVAGLVDSAGVPASKIWLVSFTNTAVKAIRDRIVLFMDNYHDARSVKITTLDSQVWYLRQGLDEQELETLFKSYDANIARITQLLRDRNGPLLDYLSEIRHIIVDEAQDLVGLRADLVGELINAVSSDCGITVFADSAQAIYGFTTEFGKSRGQLSSEMVPMIRSEVHGAFEFRELRKIYRTDSEELAVSYQNLRDAVLDDESDGIEKLKRIRDIINQISLSDLPIKPDGSLAGRKDVLLLYRKRSQVLLASAFLSKRGVAHKLRMGGQKGRLSPWIARIFHDYEDRSISEHEFLERWADRVSPLADSLDLSIASLAWRDMWSHAANPRGLVQIAELKRILARDRPPEEFLLDEDSLPGPVLGTIHGSKGREADEVHLMLPQDFDTGGAYSGQIDEEGRVTFVGATRARSRLRVGQSREPYCSKLQGSQRLYKPGFPDQTPRSQVEVGLVDDVDIHAFLMEDENPGNSSGLLPAENQDFLWENCLKYVPVVAESLADGEYPYWLRTADRQFVNFGCTGERFEYDLGVIGNIVAQKKGVSTMKPLKRIDGLFMSGAASIVLEEDDDLKGRFAEPFNRTGVFLVPVITGFPQVFFSI